MAPKVTKNSRLLLTLKRHVLDRQTDAVLRTLAIERKVQGIGRDTKREDLIRALRKSRVVTAKIVRELLIKEGKRNASG